MLIATFRTYGQEESLMNTIYGIANEISNEAGSENAEVLVEMLLELAFNPVKVNLGKTGETERLFFLTEFQVLSLVNYVNRTGPVISIYELASLPGFTRELAGMIVPFISLEPAPKATISYSSRLRQRIVATAGVRITDGEILPQPYPLKRNLRYRVESGNVSATFTASGDAGEAPLYVAGYPDFISAGIAVRGEGFLKNVVIGDFTARSGMGLALNSGYKPYLALSSSSFLGQRDGFTVYSSVNEANYLRGAAATIAAGGIEASLFISSRQRDARLKYSADSSVYADILSSAPVHSSLSSMAAKRTLTESSAGLFVKFGTGNFRGGLSATHTSFSRNVIEGGTDPSGLFSLNGKETFNAGASYRFAAGVVSAAGELAINNRGYLATAHTLNLRCNDRLVVNFIYRNYERGYYGHLAGGPGRNSITTNEQGLMCRVSFEAARGLFIYGGADVYRFPWLKESATLPSYGSRFELKTSYAFSEMVSTELLVSGAQTLKNSARDGMVPSVSVTDQRTARLVISPKPAATVSVRTNIFYKSTGAGAKGTMMAADFGYTPSRVPVSLWFRHAIFSTDNFDTALYLYENDLLYSFSVPSHSGGGSRTAAVISVKIGKNTEVRLKYSITDKSLSGSNIAQEEIKGQLSCRF